MSIEAALCLALTNPIVLGRAQSIVQSSPSRAVSHFLLELPKALREITQCLKKASLSLLENTLIIDGRLYGSMLTKPPRITLQASVPISCLLKIVMPILHNKNIDCNVSRS